jgi:dynamin 1-like protein
LINGKSDDLEETDYTGGSQIYQVFKCYANDRIKKINPLLGLSDELIIKEMRKSYGIDPGLFIPEEACRNLIRKNIDLLKEPSLKCWYYVHRILEQAITDKSVMSSCLDFKKNLRLFLIENLENLLNRNYEKLREFIIEKIWAEKSYINYDDTDFVFMKPFMITEKDPEDEIIRNMQVHYDIDPSLFKQEYVYKQIDESIRRAKKKQKDNPTFIDESDIDPWNIETSVDISKGLSFEDKQNLMSMKRVINSYYGILKKSFKSDIPKFIVKFLIKTTEERMKIEMQMALTKHKDPMSLVIEDPEIRKKREISQNNIKQLKIAMRSIKLMKRGQEVEA